MLRLKHALPLVLLVSTSVFAMEQNALVAAAAEKSGPPSDLLSTVMLREKHQSTVTALTELKQKETELEAAKKAASHQMTALIAQVTEKLASKRTQIAGSDATIKSYSDQIAALKAKAAQDEADLQTKIANEEKVKKALEAEATTLQKQIAPKEEPKVEEAEAIEKLKQELEAMVDSKEAPKTKSKGWFAWLASK